MKYKLLFLALGIVLFGIGLASAGTITIYSGLCQNLVFPNSDLANVSFTGNSSDMTGFNYTQDGSLITYCFSPLYQPDNVTLTFYNYQSVQVSGGYPYSGGGFSNYAFSQSIFSKQEISNGINKMLSLNQEIFFQIQSNHTLQLINLTDTTATLLIHSNPITESLNIGDVKNITLDNSEAMQIHLWNISYGYANISLQSIEVPQATPNTENQTIIQQVINKFKNLPTYNWIGGGIMMLIIIGLLIFIKIKLKKQKDENNNKRS